MGAAAVPLITLGVGAVMSHRQANREKRAQKAAQERQFRQQKELLEKSQEQRDKKAAELVERNRAPDVRIGSATSRQRRNAREQFGPSRLRIPLNTGNTSGSPVNIG